MFRIKATRDGSLESPLLTPSGSLLHQVDPGPLLSKLLKTLRLRHYAIRIEDAYVHWIEGLIEFTGRFDSELQGVEEGHVGRFLEELAEVRSISAGTQNQAFSAILFLFEQVLKRPVGNLSETLRARCSIRLPQVLSKEEVRRLLDAMDGTKALIAQ